MKEEQKKFFEEYENRFQMMKKQLQESEEKYKQSGEEVAVLKQKLQEKIATPTTPKQVN